MGIVDDLLAHPGLYLGIDTPKRLDTKGAAKIVVTPLPGGAGVSLDYELFNAEFPEMVRGHAEHTVIGKTHDGQTYMVIGHVHSPALDILRETSPGTFEVGPEGSAYPLKVVVTMTSPGTLRHAWWYNSPGQEPVEQDVAELSLSS